MKHFKLSLFGATVLSIAGLSPSPAFAVCTSPAATAGSLDYDTVTNTYRYCNDTSWVTIAGASAIALPIDVEGEIEVMNYGGGTPTETFMRQFKADRTIAIGEDAGAAVTDVNDALDNVMLGYQAGTALTTGDENMFLGSFSGAATTTGGSNMFMGQNAGLTNISGSSNVFIGQSSGQLATGTDNVFIGDSSGRDNLGSFNTFIGRSAGRASTVDLMTAVGFEAGQYVTGTGGTFLGTRAGRAAVGVGQLTGVNNTFVGHHTGLVTTSGANNTFLGNSSGTANTTGNYNTFLGSSAGDNNTSGRDNIAIGYNALGSNTTGVENIAIGTEALFLSDTKRNQIAIGFRSLRYGNSTSVDAQNIAIGSYSMQGVNGSSTGMRNVALGHGTGGAYTSAFNNVLIGTSTGSNITTGDDNILIGYDIDLTDPTDSDHLNIGDTITGDMATGQIAVIGTASLAVPSGTTAQRPSTGVNGMIRYNSTTAKFEGYEADAWANIIASGSSLWTDNTTHISREGVHIFAAGENMGSAGFDFGNPIEGLVVFTDQNAINGGDNAGVDDGYVGNASFAWGAATAAGNFAIALGENLSAGGNNSIAIGNGLTSSGAGSIAIGTSSQATNTESVVIGSSSDVSGIQSMALGLGETGGTRPIVSANNSLGIFMGDQDSVNLATTRTMLLAGGSMIIDPAVPATQFIARGALDLGAATDALITPRGTTAQRPSTGVNGMIRYNSTTNKLETYENSAWADVLGGGGALNDLSDAHTDYATDFNLIIGRSTATALASGAQGNIFIGQDAGATSADSTATTDRNIALGQGAIQYLTSGQNNTAVGSFSGQRTTTGSGNVMMGLHALQFNDTGSGNVAIGTQSQIHSQGDNNVSVGTYSLYENNDGSQNVAIGQETLFETRDKIGNTAVGYQALSRFDSNDEAGTVSTYNTAIGHQALLGSATSANNTGTNNTAIGKSALVGNTSGSNNIAVGYQAGDSVTTGANNILLGHDVDTPTATTDNHLNIGNTIYGDMATGNIAIAGTAALTVPSGTAAQRPTAADGMIRYKTDATIGFEVRESGAWVAMGSAVSDKRLKRDIEPLDSKNILDRLAQVGTYQYSMKNDTSGRVQYGVIAQELNDIFPELVDGSEDDAENMMSVRYTGFIAPLIEATKELKAENESLKNEMDVLKTSHDTTHAKLEALSENVALLNKYTGNNVGKASMASYWLILLGFLAGLGIMFTTQRVRQNR